MVGRNSVGDMAFRPARLLGLNITATAADWTEEKKTKLSQLQKQGKPLLLVKPRISRRCARSRSISAIDVRIGALTVSRSKHSKRSSGPQLNSRDRIPAIGQPFSF